MHRLGCAVEQQLEQQALFVAAVADLAQADLAAIDVGEDGIFEAALREEVVLHADGEEVLEGAAAEAHDVAGPHRWQLTVGGWQLLLFERVDDRWDVEAPRCCAAKERCHFVDGVDGRDEERLLFQLVLDGADAVHCSFAGSDGFGKVLRRSTFLRGLTVVSCQLSRSDNRQPTTVNHQRQIQLLAKSGTQSVFDGYLFAGGDDAIVRAKLAAALETVSPTHLEDFGECPQKFLLKHVLHAREVEDPEHELQMNARDKGKVDHRILERFYRGVMSDGAELEPALAARVDALVDETYDELARIIPPFNPTMREIERAATRRILRDFLTRDIADLNAAGLRPKEFEYKCDVTIDGVHVEGWIDRVDAGAGRFRVIDYKGGKATRHKDLGKKIDRGVRLQLPLYAIAVAQRFGAGDVSGAIKPLVFPEVKADKFAFELREKEAAVRATLALFVSAIAEGRFPAFPADTDKDFNACKYCPVSHSCRTRHDLTEKYAVVHGYGDARTLLGGGE